MKILLASHVPDNPLGGASRVYHLLSEGLRARGHAVTLMHWEDYAIPRRLERVGLRLARPYVMSRALRASGVDGYDVVMTSNGMLYPLFRELRTEKKRPYLVNHTHGLEFFDHQARVTEASRGHERLSLVYRLATGKLPVTWDARGARYADLSIVQNQRDRDYLAETHGRDDVISIPLPLISRIAVAAETALAPELRDPASLLWFGSWVDRKGCHYLARAFEAVCASFPQATLTIGGTGLPADTIAPTFSVSVRERVRVLPRISIDEQIAELNGHAIFLFPSLSEGFGFALLEAMAMGLAPVTTMTGMGADWLVDREHAMIVPAGSALHIAEAVSSLIRNPELRVSVARNAARLASRFTIDAFVEGYEAAFERRAVPSRT